MRRSVSRLHTPAPDTTASLGHFSYLVPFMSRAKNPYLSAWALVP